MNYNTLATTERLTKTIQSLSNKGYKVHSVENTAEALEKVKSLIPDGASITNGSSKTLEAIGFTELLKSKKHNWNNLHEAIINEKDPVKQSKLRKESALSDVYLGSVHALTENGELLIASNTGSQMPNIVFSSSHLIFVIGTQKIVTDINDGMERIDKHVVPLEDERSKEAYGVGTALNKLLIFKGENPMIGRTIDIVLVNEVLGF